MIMINLGWQGERLQVPLHLVSFGERDCCGSLAEEHIFSASCSVDPHPFGTPGHAEAGVMYITVW